MYRSPVSFLLKKLTNPSGKKSTCTRTFWILSASVSQQHVKYCEQQNYIGIHITYNQGNCNWDSKHVGLWQTRLHPLSRELLTVLKYTIKRKNTEKGELSAFPLWSERQPQTFYVSNIRPIYCITRKKTTNMQWLSMCLLALWPPLVTSTRCASNPPKTNGCQPFRLSEGC